MSTREQAILYWILIAILLIVLFGRKNGILDSLRDVIKYTIELLLNPISIVILVANLIYLVLAYYFVYTNKLGISLWYIKDYSIVLLFSVYPIVEYLKETDLKQLARNKKTELFGIAVVPLFINSSYTLPVILEMILVFVLIVLALLKTIADHMDDAKIVSNFFNFFLVSISLYMLLSSFAQFVKNIDDIFTLDFWLSFGLEPLVWIINIPIIILAREMIKIERKILFSDRKNRLRSYIYYCRVLLRRKWMFRKYKNINYHLSKYIQEAKELSAIGGNRIYIKLNRNGLSNEELIAIATDAILGLNTVTKITTQREKYPNVVEIVDENEKICIFWQDNFLAPKWRDTRIDGLKTTELLEGIKLVVH
ncbi:hypothetical protein [Enterococcus sp. AZ072]|uniref:hypothetical protein n=1 Tax=unclassified Enterococcus TaxID=2608891 RepID=UPI003D2C05B8